WRSEMMSRLFQFLSILLASVVLAACETTAPVTSGSAASMNYIANSPARVYISLAQAYSQKGQLDSAMSNADKVVSLDPANPRAHAIFAHVSERLGDYSAAARHFETARALAANDPFVQGFYGLHLCGKGHYAAADREFAMAATSHLNRAPETAWLSAGSCYERAGDNEMARARYRRAYEINGTPQIVRALARVEKKLGNRRESGRLLRQLDE
ncbi:tetratricopeptide repeat protein, partial [Solemya elarraichensis gill symbiont]